MRKNLTKIFTCNWIHGFIQILLYECRSARNVGLWFSLIDKNKAGVQYRSARKISRKLGTSSDEAS